MRELFCIAVVI